MCIYKITNLINNKVYIGLTKVSITNRWYDHLRHCRNKVNKPLYNSINKYGVDKFTIKIIDSCDDGSQLEQLEIKYIAEYKSTDRQFGYNLTHGGESCFNMSDEVKQRASERMTGTTMSQESIDKMKQTLASRTPEEVKAKIEKELATKRKNGTMSSWGCKTKEAQQKTLDALVKANTGAKRSDESRKRMSESAKNKNMSPTAFKEARRKASETLKKVYEKNLIPFNLYKDGE